MKKLVLIPLLLLSFAFASQAQVIVKIKPVAPKVVIVKPAAPSSRHIWIDGHWKWDKIQKQYVWVEGYWIKQKRGHAWVDGHWLDTPNGFKWVPGHWKRN
jgi:hypothetical protein